MVTRADEEALLAEMWDDDDDDDDLLLSDAALIETSTKSSGSKLQQPQASVRQKAAQGKTTWIASSFDDFDDFGQSSQGSTSSRPGPSRKRSRDQDVSNTRRSQAVAATGSRRGHRKAEVDTWVEKYTPRTQGDLAVHKKKIAEVQEWIQESLNNMKGGAVCLLTGPAGAGKTATVRVLAAELHLELQEWSNPVTEGAASWSDDLLPTRPDFIPIGGQQRETQTSKFRDFLLRANRYPTLQIGDQNQSERKLILVEELPHIFFRDVSPFQEIIREHCRGGVSPLVFVLSDTASGESAERMLFPKQLQAELGMRNISFNPIATTSMVKVMQKVASGQALQFSHRFETPSKTTLEALADASGGDIRGALNALQFVCLRGCTDATAAVAQSRKAQMQSGRSRSATNRSKQQIKSQRSVKAGKAGRKAQEAKEDHLAAIGGRDTSLFLFRALGKILYCKRADPSDYPDCPQLPAHLKEEERDPLLIQPEDVVEKCHLSSDYFTSYLHHNYPGFFSSVEDVVRAADYLSDSDYLMADWVGRPTLREYSSSVAARGIIHANSAKARAASGASSGFGWKPLHKPAWHDILRKMRDNIAAARGLFPELTFISPPQELLTQVLPFLMMTRRSQLRQGQSTHLHQICRFTDRGFNARTGVRLDEKEVDTRDNEDEDGLLCSMPPPHREGGSAPVTKELASSDEEPEPRIEEFDD